MAATLGLEGLGLPEVNEAAKALRATLDAPDPRVRLAIANSLWAQQGLAYRPDFVERNAEGYGAELARLDFADPGASSVVIRWVEEKTRGKIDRIVDHLDPGIRLVILNAIYFKGAWEQSFDEARTEVGVFTLPDGQARRHPMMHQSGMFPYLRRRGHAGDRLPFGRGRLRMNVLLPRQPGALRALQGRLGAGGWEALMVPFGWREGELALPRFRLEYAAELAPAPAALGLGAALDPGADFQGICDGPIWLGSVAHRAVVEVNEDRAEAAAATDLFGSLCGRRHSG